MRRAEAEGEWDVSGNLVSRKRLHFASVCPSLSRSSHESFRLAIVLGMIPTQFSNHENVLRIVERFAIYRKRHHIPLEG